MLGVGGKQSRELFLGLITTVEIMEGLFGGEEHLPEEGSAAHGSAEVSFLLLCLLRRILLCIHCTNVPFKLLGYIRFPLGTLQTDLIWSH